jgi:hypothetical protein
MPTKNPALAKAKCLRYRLRNRETLRRKQRERYRADGGAYNRAYSKDRTKEYREAERARAAEKAGKVYVPREQRKAASVERKRLARIEAETKKAERKAARDLAKAKCPPPLPAEIWRKRYRNDPAFALKERARASLRRTKRVVRGDLIHSAIRNGYSLPPCLTSYVDYTTEQLWLHLKRQFKGRMSERAFLEGRIHIDHIIPLSSFDLTDPQEIRAAWALSNLRPMWAKANIAKGARRLHLI